MIWCIGWKKVRLRENDNLVSWSCEDKMKVVILAGGRGTRISEESVVKPKPMIEIGEYPILWHIMKYYSSYGYDDFIICCGYKGYVIKEYFANYFLHHADVTFDFRNGNEMEVHENVAEPWKVTLVDTGIDNQTGSRIKQIQKYVGNEKFMLTYGDGVSDVDLDRLIEFHNLSKTTATMTAVQPGGRFGVLDIDAFASVSKFTEKAKEDGGWINGGFMVLEPEIFDYIPNGNNVIFEREPLENLAKDGKLKAFKHNGFWQCMDTMRDKIILNSMWESGNAPWKGWK